MPFDCARPAWLVLALLAGLLSLLWLRGRGFYSPLRQTSLFLARFVAVAALAGAAGGLAWSQPSRNLNLIALVDESASMNAPRRRAAADLLAGMRAGLPAGNGLAVVRFAGEAALESGLATAEEGHFSAGLDRDRTNLEGALRVALTRCLPGAMNRLLLLSDGEETDGNALSVLPEITGRGLAVWSADLSALPRAAVELRAASAPPRLHPGEPFTVRGIIVSGSSGRATVVLSRDGVPVETQEVGLERNEEKEATFAQEAGKPGIARYRMEILPREGLELLSAVREVEVEISPPPPVTYLADDPEAAALLRRTLERSDFRVEPLTPEAWDAAGAPVPHGGVILLDDVAAASLGIAGMERIERLVREGGAGLILIGGPHALGAGGIKDTPLERVLPVVMGASGRGPEAEIGLVIVIDASFSMYYRGRSGNLVKGTTPRKIEIAKAAIIEVLRALRPQDQIGVLESKDQLYWLRRPGPGADLAALEEQVNAVRALGGGINFYSSVLEAGKELRKVAAPIRLIMVICDTADIDQYRVETAGDSAELVRRLAGEGIALSIFAIGYPTDKDVPFLKAMADLSRGDFFLVADLLGLPRYLRAEYEKKAGEWFREGEFRPLLMEYAALLDRVDTADLPPVSGVNLVTTKKGAAEILTTDDGSAFLSAWSFGRGKAAVFAADNGTKWAGAWMTWPDAERFWRQLLFRLAPAEKPPLVETRAEVDRERKKILLRLPEQEGGAPETRELSFALEARGRELEAALSRTGLETYEAMLPGNPERSYRYRIRDAGGEKREIAAGFLEVPVAGEQQLRAGGVVLLSRLVRESGGKWISSAAELFSGISPAPRERPDPVFWLLVTALLALFIEFILRYD